jgi:hypothetical protein
MGKGSVSWLKNLIIFSQILTFYDFLYLKHDLRKKNRKNHLSRAVVRQNLYHAYSLFLMRENWNLGSWRIFGWLDKILIKNLFRVAVIQIFGFHDKTCTMQLSWLNKKKTYSPLKLTLWGNLTRAVLAHKIFYFWILFEIFYFRRRRRPNFLFFMFLI